jgi:serine/threonine protein kinase
MSTKISTILGRYEIEDEIGRGAMGVVYRALDPKIDRIVAIKTISMLGQESDEEQNFRERFFQEARAAGRLSHPGIVTIFDVGEEPETHEPYIVMEYVKGQPLSKILAANNRKLPLGAALHLAQTIAETLHYAHTQGVVHRDIKPANILVTDDGRCKITDFGIAKLNQANLTAPGRTLGSPAYMAPEQLSGEGGDSRSDLFSLGVILYTILTGHRPFQGNSAATVMFKVVNNDPVAVSALDSELPPEIDRVVSKSIAKDPAQRYQSGLQMAQEIQQLRRDYDLMQETAVALAGVAKAAVPRRNIPKASTLSEISFTNSRPTPMAGAVSVLGGQISSTNITSAASNSYDHMAWAGVIGLVAVCALTFWEFSDFKHSQPDPAAVAVPGPHPSRTSAILDMLGADSIEVATSYAARMVPRRAHEKPKTVLQPNGKVLPAQTMVKSNPTPVALANLQLKIEHSFPIGQASVWLDNVLIYTRALHGENKTHAIVFKTVKGEESDKLAVSAGEHRVHVRIQSSSRDFDQSKTITGTFAAGGDNVLHITCDTKTNQIQMALQ